MLLFNVGISFATRCRLSRCLPQACRVLRCRTEPWQRRHTSAAESSATPPSAVKSRRWTREEDDILLRLRKEGLTCSQMIIEGRNDNSKYSRLDRLAAGIRGEDVAVKARESKGLKERSTPLSEPEKAEIVRLMRAGVKYQRVASKLNKGWHQIWNYWQHFIHTGQTGTATMRNDSPSKRTWTDDETTLLAGLKTAGFSWREVCRRMPHRSMASLNSRWQTRLCPSRKYSKDPPADKTSLRSGRWSLSERIQLLEAYQQGLSAVVVAKRLGRSVSSVDNQVQNLCVTRRPTDSASVFSQRLNILLGDLRSRVTGGSVASTRRTYTSADIQTIRDLFEDGTPNKYIAQYLGRTLTSIQCKTRGGLVGLKRSPWRKAEKEQLLEYCERGLSIPEIAAALGRSEHSVRGNLGMLPPGEAVSSHGQSTEGSKETESSRTNDGDNADGV